MIMKKIVKYGVLLTACAFTLSSCNCYKKMARNVDQVNVVANPEVLTLKGQNVVTDVTVTFPERFYNPKAILKITPILSFEGGVLEGAPKFLQGDRVKDNYPVISRRSGGVYTQTISIPWDPRARLATLDLRVDAKCDGDTDFDYITTIPVAYGVNTLQQHIDHASAMIVMPDAFKRVTQDSEYTDIMYQINRAEVRPVELTKEQTRIFEEFVKENSNKDRVTMGNIQAKGYASPDGPENFNDKLSAKRSESGQAAVGKQLNKVVPGLNYDVASFGEDWDGFKKLVEQSDIKDRALILQVLNMYTSSSQRENEIRNMSQVFEELKNDILPQLRRTQMLANIDIQGKTDAELRDAVRSDINSLSLEEMLFAATLFDDNATRTMIYKTAADKFNDARAFNNLGIEYVDAGDYAKAEAAFAQAARLSSDPALNNNLALTALAQGDLQGAQRYLANATNEARAIAAVTEGNYSKAAAGLEGYNKAVAEVLNGNLTSAKRALTGIETADANYLRGVIAAKEGDSSNALSYIKKAIEQNPSLKQQALTDVNLRDVVTAANLL